MATVHEGEKPFKCNLCNFASAFNSNLKNHYVRNHAESIEKGMKHNCSECIFSTETKTLLLKHIRKVHGVIMPYHCSHCDYKGATLQWLQKHYDSVHEGTYIELKKIKCPQCEKAFNKEDRLNVHVQIVHEGKKPFHCIECEAVFWSAIGLQHHVESVHVGKRSGINTLLIETKMLIVSL